mmetsp:Transcript_1154/g.1871  ORF Transcript_1154/g.1871 Transcript_1154/m.1871 type:complete len:435 (+) Transcript_1154:76-1380(+)
MLPWCLRNKRLMSTAAHVNCSVWEAVARNRSMLGQRTLLVVSGTGNDEENETNLRMQYELSKIGIQVALFHCEDDVPHMDTIQHAYHLGSRVGVTSIVALGYAGVIDTAKCTKYFLETNVLKLGAQYRNKGYKVPLLALPTTLSYTPFQPSVGLLNNEATLLRRMPSPAPDHTHLDYSIISEYIAAHPTLLSLSSEDTFMCYQCAALAKSFDLLFAAVYGGMLNGSYDRRTTRQLARNGSFPPFEPVLNMRREDTSNSSALENLYALSSAAGSLATGLQDGCGTDGRASLVEMVAALHLSPETSEPLPLSCIRVFGRVLELIEEYKTDINIDQVDGNDDECVPLAAREALDIVCAELAGVSRDEIRAYVEHVVACLPKRSFRLDKSSVARRIEELLSEEEEDMKTSDEISLKNINALIDVARSDFFSDLSESVQ